MDVGGDRLQQGHQAVVLQQGLALDGRQLAVHADAGLAAGGEVQVRTSDVLEVAQ